MSDLPLSIVNNRRLDKWLRFQPDRTVKLAVGKVEIGQGVLIALSQIAAEELDVALDRIDILSGDTEDAPDEGSTSSSQSIEVSGRSVRLVSAELRARVLGRLAQRLNCAPEDLTVDDGAFLQGGNPTGYDYWNFAGPEDFAADIEGAAAPKPPSAYRIVGQPVPRRDLVAKVSGAAFIHDMTFPGMLHARVLRQPSYGARLVSLDEAAVRRAAKAAIEVVRVGDFVAFVGAEETAVQRAAAAAPAHAAWTGVRTLTPAMQDASWFQTQPSDDRHLGDATPPAETGAIVSRTYARPFVAHAALGPSCGLAVFRDGHLSVWSHTQGVYPLRNSLADILGLKRDQVTVRHAHGAGCYGHNGADDAALDAAVIAMRKPDTVIRVQWRREEEFGFEPVSTAHMTRIRAALDEAGRPTDWTVEVWAGSHVQRPVFGGNMLAHEALPDPPPPSKANDPTEANGGGGTRNAFPLYDFPAKRVIHHLALATPVRTSSLRGLGALPNVYALECFMDELAERAGADPVSYRMSLLSDPRARRLIENVSNRCGWASRGPVGSGRGLGLAWSRYKNKAAYACVAVELEVDKDVVLRRVWCAADAGLVINPDGARNQLEGGIVHAASMTLKEQVSFGGNGISSLDWSTYPILTFSEVPEIETVIMHNPDMPTLGMGECTFGPTAAAIGNAVYHALGVRVREMPLTRDRIAAAMS
ncbi:MAG TPA: molybdopterin cofactor-binding domain-containing protein [Rhodopila sp.]|uniref:xanthine dehydrogenase family protein molybdopterin-binding subunit n=1 Tax=Rhodopila sp. TaxID=2480087 RepID=UPI002BD5F35E|nr:molybdopterin cofactor-binding domain-containing protein [Rhodopila sp.]HVY16005.1 molybdopterin cofactor-binding domain-containing protein [Rhodopila sp.]